MNSAHHSPTNSRRCKPLTTVVVFLPAIDGHRTAPPLTTSRDAAVVSFPPSHLTLRRCRWTFPPSHWRHRNTPRYATPRTTPRYAREIEIRRGGARGSQSSGSHAEQGGAPPRTGSFIYPLNFSVNSWFCYVVILMVLGSIDFPDFVSSLFCVLWLSWFCPKLPWFALLFVLLVSSLWFMFTGFGTFWNCIMLTFNNHPACLISIQIGALCHCVC